MAEINNSRKIYLTPKSHGYNVRFSSYSPELLACATSTNYGLSGTGVLYVFDTSQDFRIPVQFEWKDGLFDVAWSEIDKDTLVTASGDGSLQVWNLKTSGAPISVLQQHNKEVYCIEWSQGKHEHLLASASWDSTALIWDTHRERPINVLHHNGPVVYGISWSPQVPLCIATVSGNGSLCIWDLNNPRNPSQLIKAHGDETLSCSWNYFKQGIIVTSSVDGLIRGWDLRLPRQPVFQLVGHNYAVRKVKCSPHRQSQLASVSYDYTTRIWDWDYPNSIHTYENHKEFVYGLDFNDQIDGMLADCGWDESISIFTVPL